MKKKYIFIILILHVLLTSGVYSNNSIVDSLKLQLTRNDIQDSTRINTLIRLFEENKNVDSIIAFDYINEAKSIALDSDNYYKLGEIFHKIAFYYYEKSKLLEAQINYSKGVEFRRQVQDSAGLASSLRMIGVINSIKGNFEKALPKISEAYEIYQNLKDTIGISNTLNDLGVFYDKQDDSDKALYYYNRAIEMRKLAGEEKSVAQLLNNVAIIYSRREEFDKAVDYYDKAVKYASENNQTHLLSALYVNLGRAYNIMGNYSTAGNYYMLSLEIKERIGDNWGKAYLYHNMGENYYAQEYYDKAYDSYKKALDICMELELKDLMSDTYQQIASLMYEIEDYKKAYEYHKKYVELMTVILDEEKQNRIEEIHSKMEDERKADKIELLTREKEFQEKQLSRNRTLITLLIIAVVLVLMLGIFALIAYREKVRGWKFAENLNSELEDRVSKEVSENRKKDIMLAQQNKQVIMGEMISNIAHQWRQPLNTLGIIIQNIEEAYNFGEINEKYLKEKVIKSMALIEYMAQTIDDFRYFFKPEKTKELFEIKTAVKRTLTFTEDTLKKQGIEVITKVDEDIFANGYSNEYSQVVMNILNNCKDVLVERQIPKPVITINLTRKNKKSLLTIEDNAGGIEGEDINKIFEPYYTTKETTGGTGLGLYMSKIIIEKNMEGKLTVSNTENGAKFYILV